MKRMGFDLDGVFCDFNYAYRLLFIEVTKKDLFPPEWKDRKNIIPPVWDYELHFGYTSAERAEVWKRIRKDNGFWEFLPAYEENVLPLKDFLTNTEEEHELYFISTRAGKEVKSQTEKWLYSYGVDLPTVLISDYKGHLAYGLDLHCFVDDRLENILSVQEHSPSTRVYLLDKLYNREGRNDKIKVIHNIREFLIAEELI